jgi:hypothetical protein
MTWPVETANSWSRDDQFPVRTFILSGAPIEKGIQGGGKARIDAPDITKLCAIVSRNRERALAFMQNGLSVQNMF